MTMVIDYGHFVKSEESVVSVRVSKSEFKAKALEYLREVEDSGEPLVLTNHGKPTIEIRRYEEKTRDPLEELKGSVLWYHDPFEPVGEDDWEALK